MAGSQPNLKLQGRIEAVIRVLAPVLDLVIAAGETTSRFLDRGRPPADQAPAGPRRQLPPHRPSGQEPARD